MVSEDCNYCTISVFLLPSKTNTLTHYGPFTVCALNVFERESVS